MLLGLPRYSHNGLQGAKKEKMISYLEGTLKEKKAPCVIAEVNGIGYEINIPFSLFQHLPSPGQKIKIYTYLHMRENGITLYGFLDPSDREFFLNLTSLSGIGPRAALRMLAKITPSQFKKTIMEKNITQLIHTPGVGKKTAQRLILELGEIMEENVPFLEEDKIYHDGVAALISLGYTRAQAQEAISKVFKKNSDIKNDLTNLVKEALKYA